MLGMSRGAWGWLGVAVVAVCALIWQGCSDVRSPDAPVEAVATVAIAPSATPVPTATSMAATSTPTPQPQYVVSPTSKAIVASGGAVAATPQVAEDSQELPTETPVSSEENSPTLELDEEVREFIDILYAPDQGFVSLDERILRSTVIARATMRSVGAYARGYDTPTTYHSIIRFTFDVHEYLKGSGGDAITADIKIACTEYTWGRCQSSSEQEAIGYADDWIGLSNIANSRWSNRESIIFLEDDDLGRSHASGQSAATMYKFIPQNEYRNPIHDYATTSLHPYSVTDGFSVFSGRNRVWLPSTAAWSGASGADESRFMLGDEPRDFRPDKGAMRSAWFATDISLAGLKSRIKAVADMVKQGEGVEGYEECLRRKFSYFRYIYGPYTREFQIQSGLWSGSVVNSRFYRSDEYDIYFFEGDDKRFFEFDLEDDDGDPLNGYYPTLKITRPLIRGAYSVMHYHLSGKIMPCIDASADGRRDVPVRDVTWIIRATAPAGTLHEAFFDPVAIGAAVGADSDNGALTPAAFPATGGVIVNHSKPPDLVAQTPSAFPGASGVDAEIRRVAWESDAVTIEIANPPVSLFANHHIDFIAQDGNIPLRLDFDDAAVADAGVVRTFSWVRCGQPWQAGDMLMLRISESPPDLAGVTNRTSCSDAAAEQTPTPIPALTPTPEGSAAGQ